MTFCLIIWEQFYTIPLSLNNLNMHSSLEHSHENSSFLTVCSRSTTVISWNLRNKLIISLAVRCIILILWSRFHYFLADAASLTLRFDNLLKSTTMTSWTLKNKRIIAQFLFYEPDFIISFEAASLVDRGVVRSTSCPCSFHISSIWIICPY